MKQLNSKKILITGASGFLGTYIANECIENGTEIYGIDIREPSNISRYNEFCSNGIDSNDVIELFSTVTFDVIYHLAGGASVADSIQHPEKDFNALLPTTLKLIQNIHTYCPSAHLILFSSAAVYGNPTEFPVTEAAAISPMSPYGIHKALVEQLCQFYSNYYSFQLSILRIFSAYGVLLRKQLFWDVTGRYTQLENKNSALTLFGTGGETRDFIHGVDVAKAAVLIAENGFLNKKTEIYNLANGEEIKICDAISYLFLNEKIHPTCTFNQITREGDPTKWIADISKLKSIGYRPTVDIKDGLQQYFAWATEQHTSI